MQIKREVTTERVTSIVCDRCDLVADKEEDAIEYQEFLRYSDVGGYGSRIGDGVEKKVDLCESCVEEVLGKWLRKAQVLF